MKTRHYHAPALTYLEAIAACSKRTSDGWLIVAVSYVDGFLEITGIDVAEARAGKHAYERLDPAIEKLLKPID